MNKLLEITNKHRKDFKSPKATKVIQFLQAKGFLFAFPKPRWKGKLLLKDCLWVGENVEPRVMEVLPAAYIRFPGHFRDAPSGDLANAIQSLLENREVTFRGVSFQKLRFWLDCPLADKRTTPVSERRVIKSFRLKPSTVQKLKQLAQSKNLNEAEVIELLLA